MSGVEHHHHSGEVLRSYAFTAKTPRFADRLVIGLAACIALRQEPVGQHVERDEYLVARLHVAHILDPATALDRLARLHDGVVVANIGESDDGRRVQGLALFQAIQRIGAFAVLAVGELLRHGPQIQRGGLGILGGRARTLLHDRHQQPRRYQDALASGEGRPHLVVARMRHHGPVGGPLARQPLAQRPERLLAVGPGVANGVPPSFLVNRVGGEERQQNAALRSRIELLVSHGYRGAVLVDGCRIGLGQVAFEERSEGVALWRAAFHKQLPPVSKRGKHAGIELDVYHTGPGRGSENDKEKQEDVQETPAYMRSDQRLLSEAARTAARKGTETHDMAQENSITLYVVP